MTEDKKRGNNHSNDDPSNKPPNSTKPADKNNTDTPSLASRIQSSASGLARQAFSAPGSSGDAAQFLTTGSKASTSSSSALAAAEHYNQVSGPSAPSSAGAQLRDSNAGTFRSTTTPQQGGFEIPHLSEEEFAQTGNDFLEPSTSTSTTIDKGKGKAREEVSAISHTHAPEPTDGSAVISLLSDRTFDPTFPHDPAEIIETELLPPQQLTQAEIQMLESFRRHITPQPDTASPSTHRLTSASLVPEIDTILDSAPALTGTDAATLRDCVLASLPGSEDWVDVEERYHDEVWGWLKPTLEAAARELEEKEDPRGEDGPAVQRLKTVLTHMRAKL